MGQIRFGVREALDRIQLRSRAEPQSVELGKTAPHPVRLFSAVPDLGKCPVVVVLLRLQEALQFVVVARRAGVRSPLPFAQLRRGTRLNRRFTRTIPPATGCYHFPLVFATSSTDRSVTIETYPEFLGSSKRMTAFPSTASAGTRTGPWQRTPQHRSRNSDCAWRSLPSLSVYTRVASTGTVIGRNVSGTAQNVLRPCPWWPRKTRTSSASPIASGFSCQNWKLNAPSAAGHNTGA